MARPPHRPLSRDRAWSCILLNVATPGTGSMRAGRRFTGVSQLLFGVAGAALICVWMLKSLYGIMQQQLGTAAPPAPSGWLWKWGVAAFAISWCWTVVTCVDLFRQAKADEQRNRQNPPPRLADLPDKNSENP